MMDDKKEFLKGSSWLLTSNFLVLAAGFIARPLIARLLGLTEYAIFALVLSTGTALSGYLFLTLNAGIAYHVARAPRRAGELVSTSLAFLIGFSALLAVPAYFFLQWVVPELGFNGFIASFALAFALATLAILQAMEQGLRKFKALSITASSSTLLAAALSLAGASLFVEGWVAGVLRAAAILAVSVAGLAKLGRFGTISRKAFNDLWAYSRPLALAGLGSTLIVVADKYFIAAFSKLESVAPYDISMVLVSAFLPIGVSLANVMMPNIARNNKKAAAYYNRVAAVNAALLSTAGIALYYYADLVINILVGAEYVAEGVPLLRVLSLALPIMAFKNLNGSTFRGLGETKRAAAYAFSLITANIALNALFVPAYGAFGAAAATLLTYVVVLGASTLDLHLRVGVGVKQALLQLALFAGFAGAYWLFDEPGFVVKTLCLVAFAFATLALQRKLVGEVIETVKSLSVFGGNKK
mgnify:CR=1 FL=1